MEIECGSEIRGVTVHARGALVTRGVALSAPLPAGDVDIVVGQVPVLAEGGSVRARLKSDGRRLVSVQSGLVIPRLAAQPGPSVEKVRALALRVERLSTELNDMTLQRQRLLAATLEPRIGRKGKPELLGERIADGLAVSGLLGELVAGLEVRMQKLTVELHEAEREHLEAKRQLEYVSQVERAGPLPPTRQVVLRLSGDGPVSDLEFTYAVAAARWWPQYTLRLSDAGAKAQLQIEALVAQRSGEDWAGVPVALSTADLLLDAQLPELPSMRLGRAQAPKRPAYREPPEGLSRLFQGYDRGFGAPSLPTTTIAFHSPMDDAPEPEPEMAAYPMEDEAAGGEYQEQTVHRSMERRRENSAAPSKPMMPQGRPSAGTGAARPAGVMMPSMSPPLTMQAVAAPKKSGGLPGFGALAGLADGILDTASAVYRGAGGAQMDRMKSEPEPELEVGDGWLDFDGLELGAPGSGGRGRLHPRPDSVAQDRRNAVSALESLSPSRVSDVRATRGQFDHRYASEGHADVPSDGQTHRLSVAIKPGEPQLRFRSVPREDPQVFREVELKNPAEAPLLSGPVDVYVEGSLLTTSDLSYVDRGGLITVGMGVEERVRVARNVRADEENAGLLGGSTVVTHTVTLELTSSLPAPARIELLDRIPATDDKTIDVKLLGTSPEAEPYKQEDRGHPMRGGLRWRLTLGPGEKRTVEFKYKVTFNAKDELIGGNRRD